MLSTPSLRPDAALTLSIITIQAPALGTFGIAVVTGYDPSASTHPDAASISEALARHGVLCLRMPRALTDAEFELVAGLFGPVKDPVGFTADGDAYRYNSKRQVIDSGFVMTDEARAELGDVSFGGLDEERPGLFETYHCDDTFAERPASATVLHARQLPASGGGPTCFIDMRAALESLPTETRAAVDDLTVRYGYDNGGAFPPRQAATDEARVLADVTHPLVRSHARVASTSLFVDLDRAKFVEDMPVDEGRALLQTLQDHAEAHAPYVEHHWQPHDVLAWDNASVQHKARGNFKVGESRRFWRHMVEGERPRR